MWYEEHCRRCQEILGKPFPEVHKWLDELFGNPHFGIYHRCVRHNLEGIAYVKERWGNLAAEAACIHILDDISGSGGVVQGKDDIPENAEEYKRRGYF